MQCHNWNMAQTISQLQTHTNNFPKLGKDLGLIVHKRQHLGEVCLIQGSNGGIKDSNVTIAAEELLRSRRRSRRSFLPQSITVWLQVTWELAAMQLFPTPTLGHFGCRKEPHCWVISHAWNFDIAAEGHRMTGTATAFPTQEEFWMKG